MCDLHTGTVLCERHQLANDINILSSEVFLWLGLAIRFLGYTPRATGLRGALITCNVVISFAVSGAIKKFLSIVLYAIMVYVFVRCGEKWLKWKAIIPYIVVSWLCSVLTGVPAHFDAFEVFESSGFCDVNTGSLVFRILVGILFLTAIISLCIIFAFSTMTYIYIKRNTLESSVDIKKAVVKNLVYLNFAAIFSVITNIAPSIFPLIRTAFANSFLSIILTNYILRVFLYLPSLLTPIAAMITLKPIRLAMKQAIEKCCHRGENN